MLEFRDVVIQCITFHLNVHQFVMCILDFGGVSKGCFEITDERGPESFISGIDPVCQMSVNVCHHPLDPIIHIWPSNETYCQSDPIEQY
jgi:hypothetical protein